MGFLSWLFCAILVVALVLLLFPFSFRIDFEAGERGVRALFFFFKKKVYEYKKSWGKEESSLERQEKSESAKDNDSVKAETAAALVKSEPKKPEKKNEVAETPVEVVAKHPEETTIEKKDTPASEDAESVAEPEVSKADETAEKPETKPALVSEPISTETVSETEPKAEPAEPEKKPKKEKRKLSDREFWTIILTPDFDARAFKYILKILGAVFSLFRVRFCDCFVEGVRTDYQTMGYIAAVNGFMKAYPYVGDWDLRMDWCNEKDLRAAGSVRLSITLLRVFCFTLETLVLAGILALSFWRRRARVIKTNELPELGFIRRKILEFILED